MKSLKYKSGPKICFCYYLKSRMLHKHIYTYISTILPVIPLPLSCPFYAMWEFPHSISMHVLLNQDSVVLCGLLQRYNWNTTADRAPESPPIWWRFSARSMCCSKLWKSGKRKKQRGEERRENKKEERRRTFRLTFGDRHCEITVMAFQLSQIIFRNEMTNCNRELQFPPLIIYFS